MPQISSNLKIVMRSRLLLTSVIKPLIGHPINGIEIRSYISSRFLSGIARFDCYSTAISNGRKIDNIPLRKAIKGDEILQRRWFLGCGDGEEGSALSKVHEEKLVLGYSPEKLFDVVAAVDFYEDFLPWCQRSQIIRHFPDGSFDAELEIGFKFLVESYVSHVVLEKPRLIKTTASKSNLFEHLINIWEFSPGSTPETSNVYFLVDFKFNSPLYRQVATMFFKEVVSRLVSSFTDRCRLIYGPGAKIIQNN